MNPIVYNTTLLDQNFLNLEVNNRAFCYGDGLFETLLFHKGQILFWPEHFHRLQAGMAVLEMSHPDGFTADALAHTMLRLLEACQLAETARLRLQVWRQPGGLYTPTTSAIHYLITAQACPPPQVGHKAQVRFYDAMPLHHSALSAYKTCNALPYVMAGMAKTKLKTDEIVLLHTNGYLAECIASNLFWYKEDAFYTPALQTGCVAGIMRGQLLRRMREQGLSVQEGLFDREDLLEADGAFSTNVAGIQWFDQIEGYRFPLKNRQEIANALFYW